MTLRTERRDGYTGTVKRCSRCKGTKQARFNHLNGDTHCYLCDGTGETFHLTAAEKARKELDQAWFTQVYQAAYQRKLDLRRAMRNAEIAESDRGPMTARMMLFTPTGVLA